MAELVAKIESEIRNQGAIPFARFMELALYCPVYGYYEKEGDIIGRGGDYYTNVSVGKLFGQLLGCQFAEAFGGEGNQLQLVEAGAHRGDLARDILEWLQVHRPELFERLEYWILEPSEPRRQWQRDRLSVFETKTRWAEDFRGLGSLNAGDSSRPVWQVIFANELLDAMPVRRLGWDAARRCWFEWGVTLRKGQFAWVRMQPMADQEEKAAEGTELLQKLIENLAAGESSSVRRLLEVLPDGFTIEICPGAERWWRAAAKSLRKGRLVAIDYGRSFEEFLSPERVQGTLRAYRRHQVASDVLAFPGDQDITADVNFTLIEQAGRSAGLKTEFFGSQAKFFTDIAGQVWQGQYAFGEWSAECTRQFQTLTHPDHLGRRFKVLVQAR